MDESDEVTSLLPDITTQQEQEIEVIYTRESLNVSLGDECYEKALKLDPPLPIAQRYCLCYLYCIYRPLTPEEIQLRFEYLKVMSAYYLKIRIRHYMPLIVLNCVIGVWGIIGKYSV